MAMQKLSVTVDAAVLKELREQEGPSFNVSAVVNEALLNLVKRRNLLALLDEMDRQDPISPEDQAAGEKIWREIQSSWTQGPLPRSQTAKKRSASASGKR